MSSQADKGFWASTLDRVSSFLPWLATGRMGACLFAAVLAGCSAGPMEIREAHYLAVSDGDSTNYYRLRIEAQSRLGVAEYRSGWYPSRAVDGVFGAVSSEGGISALAARARIEADVSEKIHSTYKAWLDEASKADADRKKLDRLMEARRRVLAYPSTGRPPFKNSFEIEFNPAIGIATTHADEKLIFILSSNPDEVIGKIKNFAESEQTVLTISQLSQLIAKRNRNEVDAQVAVEEVDKQADARVLVQVRKAILIAEDDATTAPAAITEIETLLHLIDAVQR